MLDSSQSNEFQPLITKSGDEYNWGTRGDGRLHCTRSGAYYVFIAVNGAGYIPIMDTHVSPQFLRVQGKPRFEYSEHSRNGTAAIQYWGWTDSFNP